MTPTDTWTTEAVAATERCIGDLLADFLRQPFAHRVEHSLHVDLYNLLRQQDALRADVPIGTTGYTTRLVHKEWPSVQSFRLPREATAEAPMSTRERRQSYDLAILDPSVLANATLRELIEGRPPAAIAIELGLDYSIQHLQGDLEKLERNQVEHAYIVHFSRRRTRKAAEVKESILKSAHARTAFAHLDLDNGEILWKGLDDREMRTHVYRS